MRKVHEGQFDAVVLAFAGLRRLGWEDRATDVISPEVSLPAIGQGALGIECRTDAAAAIAALAPMIHVETAICVAAERAVMLAVDGSCRLPVAAFAVREGDRMFLRGLLADPDGKNLRRGERRAPFPSTEDEAVGLGRELGAELKSNAGAR